MMVVVQKEIQKVKILRGINIDFWFYGITKHDNLWTN